MPQRSPWTLLPRRLWSNVFKSSTSRTSAPANISGASVTSDIPLSPEPSIFNLPGLPTETQLQILTSLDPTDALAVRQTNKLYFQLSHDQALWLDLLQIHCFQHDIPLLTYNYNPMNQPILERPATQSLRAEFNFERHNPCVHGLRSLDLSIREESPSEIKDFVVIPGGRFLITGDSAGTVRCWDLWNQQSLQVTGPCAQYCFQDSRIWTLCAQRSVEYPDIIVISAKVTKPEIRFHSDLMVLQLALDAMVFTLQGTGNCYGNREWTMDGDLIAQSDFDFNVYIWNWKEDKRAYLVTDLSLRSSSSQALDLMMDMVPHIHCIIMVLAQPGEMPQQCIPHLLAKHNTLH